MRHLRLKGANDALVIGDDFWEEILEWASDNGWNPLNPTDYYRHPGRSITAEDANNLGDALEFIAGDLVLHELEVSDDFMKELLDALLTLTVFFQSGSFQISAIDAK